ncbi:phospholipase [Brachybacterium endophyticum]|uniref:Phospholipase n=1 Tax=Brachybacterium endophyticum TaxID=2182385 RepID=A0A2U2RK24_9MICO|nr:phospholipase D family protein [Brachybacterium endophyticum]PWH06229.1 phospholipase [Brachybacterium endophyticum]
MSIDDWFLDSTERDNPFTRLDHRHGGRAHTSGNSGKVHVHGAEYFARLRELIEQQQAGDLMMFTDWRGDPDERVGEDSLTIVELIAAAARRGVIVKALFWRSHLDTIHYSEAENRSLADTVREAGGEVLLDQRVLPLGSHHQKFVVLRHPDRPHLDAAFAGGIDMCHTRRDDARHHGDPQTVSMGEVWGKTPAWHDMMLEVRGPAVGDIEATFRERWDDPTPLTLDIFSRAGAVLHRDDGHGDPMPPQTPDPEPTGDLHVQVLRTFPPRQPRYPFAPSGERSIARAYSKAVPRAESLVYVEDQYVWSPLVASCYARALREHPGLHLVIVLSTYTTADTTIANASAMSARNAALDLLHEAGGDRVHVFGIENHENVPVYVHSKVCVVDDVWMTVGSDNMNLRSWTYDSELTCAVIDGVGDGRAPRSLREDGEEAGALPRAVRLQLAREHLDRPDGEDEDLVDPEAMVRAFEESAARLDAWHEGGRRGPRPAGRLRRYVRQQIPRKQQALGRVVYKLANDPDARPRTLRGTDRF